MEQIKLMAEQPITLTRACTDEALMNTINCLRADRMASMLYDAKLISADELATLMAANRRTFPSYLSDLY